MRRWLNGLLGVGGLLAGMYLLGRDGVRAWEGWLCLLMALADLAAAYTHREGETIIAAPARRIWLVIAGCTLVPCGLLVAFGDRPALLGPLAGLSMVCITVGPILLLWRYQRPPRS